MKGIVDVIMAAIALAIGSLTAFSTERWMSSAEYSAARIQDAKQEIVRSAGLFELHNRIYLEVGPYAWDSRVKPEFLRAITIAAARHHRTLLPTQEEIVEWVRSHPEETRRMLQRAADLR